MDGGGGERRDPERGAVAILSVWFVLLLLLFLGLTINIGRLLRARGDLQAASDAAALAAAESMDVKGGTAGSVSVGGTGGGRGVGDFAFATSSSSLWHANEIGESYLVMNEVGQHPVIDNNPSQDVLFGFWHWKGGLEPCAFSAGNCAHGWELSPFQQPQSTEPMVLFAINAVSVTAKYSLPTILDGILKRGNTQMRTTSTAAGRRSSVKCAMPFAFSSFEVGHPVSAGTPLPGVGVVQDRLFDPPAGLHCHEESLLYYDIDSNNGGCNGVVARADTSDQFVPAMGGGDMKNFVRSEIIDGCANDTTNVHYWVGAPTLPTIGQADGDIRPVVDGLLGVAAPGDPLKTGPCRLNQRLTVPVIKKGVKHIDSCAVAAWPPDAAQSLLVIGFVNVRVTRVTCADAAPHDDVWCNNPANAAAVAVCSGNTASTPDTDVKLRFVIECDPPGGVNDSFATATRPRLVR